MFNCSYEKKPEGDSHLFSLFFADLKPALECLLNNESLKLLNGCTIILKDEDILNAYFDKKNENIYITTGLLEYLWWLSYLNYDLYANHHGGIPQWNLMFITNIMGFYTLNNKMLLLIV